MGRKLKRVRATLFGLGMLALAGGGGVWAKDWWELRQLVVQTDNAYVRGNTAIIASLVDGYIEDIHVTSHQRVRPGDPLVTIRGERFEAAVDSARAELRAAEAEVEIGLASVENMRARRRLQASLIDQAAARVEAARAREDQAEREVARYRELLERQTGSRQKYEAVATARRTAAADRARTEAELVAAREEIPVFDSEIRRLEREIDRLRALVMQAAAALDAAEIALSDTLVTAPVAGVIGNLRVEPGMFTDAGWPMMAVVPLYDTYIIANFKETQLSRLRSGAGSRHRDRRLSRRRADRVAGQPGAGERGGVQPVAVAERDRKFRRRSCSGSRSKFSTPCPTSWAGRVVPGMSVV